MIDGAQLTIADIQRCKAMLLKRDISKRIDYFYAARPAEIDDFDFMCWLKWQRVHIVKRLMIPRG